MSDPSFKHFKAGMPYHEFRSEYQKLLIPFYPTKEYFQKKYSAYCMFHRRKENESQ